jgi:hypothetical protein
MSSFSSRSKLNSLDNWIPADGIEVLLSSVDCDALPIESERILTSKSDVNTMACGFVYFFMANYLKTIFLPLWMKMPCCGLFTSMPIKL